MRAPASASRRARVQRAACAISSRASSAADAHRGPCPARRAAGRQPDAARRERLQERALLRRDDVETVDHEKLRLPHQRSGERVRHHLRQARGVRRARARAAHAVGARPACKGGAVVVERNAVEPVEEPPRVRQRPGLGCARRGLRHREQVPAGPGRADHLLPERLRLVGREQERQRRTRVGVQGVVVEPLDERRVRQNVGGLPRGAAGGELPPVELPRECQGEPAVGRDDRDAGRVAGAELREQLLSFERGQRVRHRAG
ncbi:MAG: hypothetical protein U1F45_16215 [Burkholderiales bacterium]